VFEKKEYNVFAKNRSIEISVFVCGAVLMAVEIAGGRLLAADFGGTVYVWGSIIAFVLGGLSLGYYAGGYLADRRPRMDILAGMIGVAALLVGLIPVVYPQVSGASNPVLIVLALFFLPSILLGTVSPFAVKLRTRDLGELGSRAGNLYAMATLGSVLGTLLTTFGLILWFPLDGIFAGLAGCLFLLTVFLSPKTRILGILGIAAVLGVLLWGVAADTDPVETTERDGASRRADPIPQEEVSVSRQSLYGRVDVEDNPVKKSRAMYINGGVMGEMFLENKFRTVPGWEYVDLFEDLALVGGKDKEVLSLGVGPGLVASRLSEHHGMSVDAVDINGVVLELAQEYFGLSPGENLSLFEEDARVFLRGTEKKYDLIEMDAFTFNRGVYTAPPHLTTKEFFQEVKDHLRDDGMFIMMLIEKDDFFRSEYKTLGSVFENVHAFDCFQQVLAASEEEQDLGGVTRYNACDPVTEMITGGEVFSDNFSPINQFGG